MKKIRIPIGIFWCSNTPFWSKIEHCDLVFKWRKLRIFCCIGESIFCQHLFKINTRRIKNVSLFLPGANKIMQNLKKNWVVCSFKTFSVFCHKRIYAWTFLVCILIFVLLAILFMYPGKALDGGTLCDHIDVLFNYIFHVTCHGTQCSTLYVLLFT